MKLRVLSSAPTLAPDQMSQTEVGVIPTRGGVELRIQCDLSGAVVAVRPWYYLGGKWHPARADGASGVGIEPVTADPAKFNGRANGIFMAGPLAVPFCLVVEAGDYQHVTEADLTEYFARGS